MVAWHAHLHSCIKYQYNVCVCVHIYTYIIHTYTHIKTKAANVCDDCAAYTRKEIAAYTYIHTHTNTHTHVQAYIKEHHAHLPTHCPFRWMNTVTGTARKRIHILELQVSTSVCVYVCVSCVRLQGDEDRLVALMCACVFVCVCVCVFGCALNGCLNHVAPYAFHRMHADTR